MEMGFPVAIAFTDEPETIMMVVTSNHPIATPRRDKAMRRILLIGVVLLAGCQGVSGPRDRRGDLSRPDNPELPIELQKQIGRDRLALPESSRTLVPRDNGGFTGPYNP